MSGSPVSGLRRRTIEAGFEQAKGRVRPHPNKTAASQLVCGGKDDLHELYGRVLPNGPAGGEAHFAAWLLEQTGGRMPYAGEVFDLPSAPELERLMGKVGTAALQQARTLLLDGITCTSRAKMRQQQGQEKAALAANPHAVALERPHAAQARGNKGGAHHRKHIGTDRRKMKSTAKANKTPTSADDGAKIIAPGRVDFPPDVILANSNEALPEVSVERGHVSIDFPAEVLVAQKPGATTRAQFRQGAGVDKKAPAERVLSAVKMAAEAIRRKQPHVLPTPANFAAELQAQKELTDDDVRRALMEQPSLDTLTDKIKAVLDAAGFDTLLGLTEGAIARELTRVLAERIFKAVALYPVREKILQELTRVEHHLEPFMHDAALRQREAALLAELPHEQARQRLVTLGIADIDAVLGRRSERAYIEDHLQKVAHTVLAGCRSLRADLANLDAKVGRVQPFKISRALTRMGLGTESLGLDPRDFPFEDVEPRNAAQEAVLGGLDAWDRDEEVWLVGGLAVLGSILTAGIGGCVAGSLIGAGLGAPALAMDIGANNDKRVAADLGYETLADVKRERLLALGSFVFGAVVPNVPKVGAAFGRIAEGAVGSSRGPLRLHWEELHAGLKSALGVALSMAEVRGANSAQSQAASDGEDDASLRHATERAFEVLKSYAPALRQEFARVTGDPFDESAFSRCMQVFALYNHRLILALDGQGAVGRNRLLHEFARSTAALCAGSARN